MNQNKNHYQLKISGGTVVRKSKDGSTREERLDLGIIDGKIAAMGDLSLSTATENYSATGLHILPGMIDSQVHFREPGLTHKEDLETGTKAATLGGIVAVFEMPNTKPPTTTASLLEDKIKAAAGRSWCDIGFYVGACPENVDQLATLETHAGSPGIKIFMGSSTGSLLVAEEETLLKILKSGTKRVAVHAEDEERLIARKHIALESKNPRVHPDWRDAESALIATQRLLRLAKIAKRPVHVLHVSTAQELEFLSAHKNLASIEALPQHLILSAPECYERLGNFAQQNPPIRSQAHQSALWTALQKGIIDVIASDHAPHTIDEKKMPYPESPSGMPGVQTILPLMLHQVAEKKLSLIHLVSLMSENPARLFQLQGFGEIRVGAPANLSIVDLKAERRIENKWMASRCQWTPFDGMKVTGWPISSLLRGQFILRDEQLTEKPNGEILHFG